MSRYWFGERRDRRLVASAEGRGIDRLRLGDRMAYEAAKGRDDVAREREDRSRRSAWLDQAQRNG